MFLKSFTPQYIDISIYLILTHRNLSVYDIDLSCTFLVPIKCIGLLAYRYTSTAGIESRFQIKFENWVGLNQTCSPRALLYIDFIYTCASIYRAPVQNGPIKSLQFLNFDGSANGCPSLYCNCIKKNTLLYASCMQQHYIRCPLYSR